MSKDRTRRRRERVRRRRKQRQEDRYSQLAEAGFARLNRRTRHLREEAGVLQVRRTGEYKVSQAVLDLLAEELELCSDEEETERLLLVAMLAWNLTLLPPREAAGFLRKSLKDMSRGAPRGLLDVMEAYIRELAERKERMFPQYRDFILDYELTVEGDYRHLAVMTSPAAEFDAEGEPGLG
jgi:hypothetical protein